jgi:ATP-dependent Clp protease ATP-binding subunit ClpX
MPIHIQCSFCGKPRNEVRNIVAANPDEGPFICNRCIERAAKEISAGKKGGIEKEPQKEFHLPKPREIRDHVKNYVIGQDTAINDVAIAVYNHYKRRLSKDAKIDEDGQEPIELDKSNILMLGPSGSGKTFVVRSLARMLNVPFHVGDATKLTQAGYVGDDVETLLQGLLLDAQGDVEKAQWGIVFLDEVDKVARGSGRDRAGYRDVSGEGVQQALLKLLEGSKLQVPRGGGKAGMVTTYDVIDTTNILFICAGAFSGVEEIVSQRLNKGGSRLGFGADHKKVKMTLSEAYSQVTEDDVMDFGIIPEMMGRLPVITSTIELTEDQLVEVLTKPKNSIIKQVQAYRSGSYYIEGGSCGPLESL